MMRRSFSSGYREHPYGGCATGIVIVMAGLALAMVGRRAMKSGNSR